MTMHLSNHSASFTFYPKMEMWLSFSHPPLKNMVSFFCGFPFNEKKYIYAQQDIRGSPFMEPFVVTLCDNE